MEWFFELFVEIAQFLDGVPDFEDLWELRQSISSGSSYFLALLNSAVAAGGGIQYLHTLPSLEFEQKSFISEGPSIGPSRHSSFHQSHSAIGYQSIEPLSLSSRTVF